MLQTSHNRAIWRRQFGGMIYEDVNYYPGVRQVGIYNFPSDMLDLNLGEDKPYHIPDSVFYSMMQLYSDALAVFEVRGDELAILTDQLLHLLVKPNIEAISKKTYTFRHKNPIIHKTYKHVGYIKTYQPSFLIYQWPYYLLQDTDGKIVDYDVVVTEQLQEQPPLAIYRDLINTEYDAVYKRADGTLGYVRKE